MMIPKMGRDSQGSTLVCSLSSFIVLFMFLFVDLNIFIALFMLSSLFIALFLCFELFIAIICRSEYIYCFVYIYYVLVNIVL